MSALVYLIQVKTWGIIRGWFRKPVGAVLTVLALLLFAFAIVGVAIYPPSEVGGIDFSWVALGVSVLMYIILLISLVQRKKALVFLNDASFVLSGPFTRKQIMAYILMNGFVQTIWITLGLMGYVLLFLRSSLSGIGLLLSLMLGIFVFGFFLVVVTSYDYVLEKTISKYTPIKKILVYASLLLFLIVCMIQVIGLPVDPSMISVVFESFQVHVFPVYGWLIGALYHAHIGDWTFYWLYNGVLIVSTLFVGWLFFIFKGDFYEQAIMDSEFVSELIQKARTGNDTEVALFRKDIKDRKVTFRNGAWVLWSRFVLQAKKTNQLFRATDLVFFVLYSFIAWFGGSIEMYRLMISLVIFITINSDVLQYELRRPFVYLIPEDSFKKLLIMLLPMIYRLLIILVLSGFVAWLGFDQTVLQSIMFVVSLMGIGLVLVSGTVWTIKILKGQKNPLVEQLIRMVVITVALIPGGSAVVLLTLFVVPMTSPDWSFMFASVMLLVNVVFMSMLLYHCRKILEGNDMFV